MDYLIFQLQAPLSAWGETAVGEYRPTANYPSESALIGLLAAALGVDREDEDAHQSLSANYGFAIGVQSAGRLLRDYHTIQVATESVLKKQPHYTRRDELTVPPEKRKDHLKTILSTRDYRQDAACLVAVQSGDSALYSLETLSQALQKPKYVLYLGRKACPPALPLWPKVLDANNALVAIEKYRTQLIERAGGAAVQKMERLVWGAGIDAGIQEDIQVVRKDRLLSRQNWQFGDRQEFVAFLGGQ